MKLTTVGLIRRYQDQVIAIFSSDTGVKTIGDFVKRTEALAKEMYPDSDKEDDNNPAYKFKGDMLEILGEIFFNVYLADTAVGLREYQSVPITEDYGVDGIGINVNGDQVAVQMKYKANPLTPIEYSEISKTYNAAIEIHNIPLYLPKNDTIFVFTTGDGSTAALQAVNKNKVRIIDRKIIAGKIDDNETFWIQANNLLWDTLE
jgi:hypothetical protein